MPLTCTIGAVVKSQVKGEKIGQINLYLKKKNELKKFGNWTYFLNERRQISLIIKMFHVRECSECQETGKLLLVKVREISFVG